MNYFSKAKFEEYYTDSDGYRLVIKKEESCEVNIFSKN